MTASETELFKLLGGQKQFCVPLFQRTYGWNRDNWRTLWNDLVETAQNPGATHFFGTTVTKQMSTTPQGVGFFLVIDGQQRLTTLTLLLAALRDEARQAGETALADKLHNLYIANQYVEGESVYKVMPTQGDRDVYRAIVDGHSERPETHRMVEAYGFFRRQISAAASGTVPEFTLEQLQNAVLLQFELVNITLAEDDNEYKIFESLNATGEPLTQADLIRNHVFMKVPGAQQETVYQNLWRPLELVVGPRLADYFRTQLQAEGTFVREGDVYAAWKKRLIPFSPEQIEAELGRLNREGEFYARLLDPAREHRPAVSRGLERLNRWRGDTVHPFLFNLYRALDREEITAEEMGEILHVVESFLVRRFLAGVPTNQLNRLFLRLYATLPDGSVSVDTVRRSLSEDSKRWPDDETLRQKVRTFPLYREGQMQQRRLILDTLAERANGKEPVNLTGLNIEHVMPQTLTDEWREHLGDHAAEVHKAWLHTLANLTLTGYNSELSNAPFGTKRGLLDASSLHQNRRIAQNERWTEDELARRADELADQIIALWPGPVVPSA